LPDLLLDFWIFRAARPRNHLESILGPSMDWQSRLG
jgi:hypothetical protein